MDFSCLNRVRERNPLVQNITNTVAANFSANGLLAAGASPIMAEGIEEMDDMAALADALLINTGTLTAASLEAMLKAGRAANRAGVPVVLDPVGVAATPLRRRAAALLLEQVRFTAVRGNAGELACLAGIEWQSKGVDAGSGAGSAAEIAAKVARRYSTVAAVSGACDHISDGRTLIRIANGTPLLPKVTASGCLLGSLTAAYLAVAGDALTAAAEAHAAYAVAAEKAAAGLDIRQSGTFAVRLIDEIGMLTAEAAAASVRMERSGL